MKIPAELFEACSYFIPRIMFLETHIAPKVEWGDVAEVLSGYPEVNYDLSSQSFWDLWLEQWEKLGETYFLQYQSASDEKYRINCLRRSCACFHWGEFMYFSDKEKKIKVRNRIREQFLLYLNSVELSHKYNSFVYENIKIPYFIFYPEKSGVELPTIILCNGLDSMTEVELYSIAEFFLREGYAVVLFDPPGQGINIGQYPLEIKIEGIVD